MTMRYTHSIALSMPIFIVGFIWGGLALSGAFLAVALSAAISLGVCRGYFMSRMLCDGVLLGKPHCLCQTRPAWFWCFVALGTLGGAVGALIPIIYGPTRGWLILRAGAVVVGTLLCTAFGVIALVILQLERREGRKVYMGGPNGLFFEESRNRSASS